MAYNYPNNRKTDYSKGWFSGLMGNVLISIAGGLALLFGYCLLMNVDGVPTWASLTGLVICGILAYAGNRLRTRTIHVDPETGRVKKKNL